jgi:hypothetical protein
MDSQKHYESFIFIYEFLEEIVGNQLKVVSIILVDCFILVFFLSTSTFLCTHFRSASIINADQLHSFFVGYYHQPAIVIN